jgi:hypothetical protein
VAERAPRPVVHPHFAAAVVDAELGIEVAEHDLTLDTTFAHIAAPDRGAVSAEFLSRAGLPSHALVIRPNAPGADGPIFKGVADDATLANAIARCAQGSADGLAAIETDMRADRNPTRMRHIARLAKRLAARPTRRCPDCGTPATEPSPPSVACRARRAQRRPTGSPCSSTAARAAPRRRPRPRDDGLRATDPAHCARCNP